jgi:hypothetical protein
MRSALPSPVSRNSPPVLVTRRRSVACWTSVLAMLCGMT